VKNCKNDEDKLGLILILLANGAKVSFLVFNKLYATFTAKAVAFVGHFKDRSAAYG